MRHTDGRCRSPIYRGNDIYGAPEWGKTHSNVFISKIEGRRSRPPAFMWIDRRLQLTPVGAQFTTPAGVQFNTSQDQVRNTCNDDAQFETYVHASQRFG